MPTISIDFTANQVQRILSALGPVPENFTGTQQEWVAANIKGFLKDKVKQHEAMVASNNAFNAARGQVDTDFTGF